MLTEDTLGAFETLHKACLKTPVLAFADFNKLFLLETDVSKLGLGAVLSQKQTDGQYHPVAYASHSLTVNEHNYHSTKQEFLYVSVDFSSCFNNVEGDFLLNKINFVGRRQAFASFQTWLPQVWRKCFPSNFYTHKMCVGKYFHLQFWLFMYGW